MATGEQLVDFVDSIAVLLLHGETGYRGEPDYEYMKANHELLEQLIKDARALVWKPGEEHSVYESCL